MLFAQAGGGGGGGNQGPPPEVMAVLLIAMLIGVAIGLVIQIFFLLTLSRCLSRIAPTNRRMEPGMVWLNLIPCFNLIWTFVTNIRLADSLDDEFHGRRLSADGDFGRTLGIVYPILNLLGIIPYVGVIFSLAGLVCWIMYWVKIAGYSRRLAESPSQLEEDYRDDYRDDYRGDRGDRNYRDDQ